jgi:2-polyprenyl-6-methoxyphenol hydroxylase-like FAD-dependent oxidoreductase
MDAPLNQRYDAIVVGARCAGAATAMLLARRGLSVLLFDRDRRGADTLSTLAMMRAGVLQLRRWGLLEQLRETGAPDIRSTSFVYGDEVITVPIKPRDGVNALAPRRRCSIHCWPTPRRPRGRTCGTVRGSPIWSGARVAA